MVMQFLNNAIHLDYSMKTPLHLWFCSRSVPLSTLVPAAAAAAAARHGEELRSPCDGGSGRGEGGREG